MGIFVSCIGGFAYVMTINDFPMKGDIHKVNFSKGDSAINITADLCAQRNQSICFEAQDVLSFNMYGVSYTPSLPHHTVEDFYMGRVKLVRYLVERFGYKSYLEIGCDANQTFGKSQTLFANYAYCVDPNQGGTHRMTSDAYFAKNKLRYDLIFVDGLHDAIQVLKDVDNALRVLNDGGI